MPGTLAGGLPVEIEDDYRQPGPFASASGFGGFASYPDEHVKDSIARIEALKLRLMGSAGLAESERLDMLSELNTLRAAYLHLFTQTAPRADEPPPAAAARSDLVLEGVLGTHPEILANLDRIARFAPSRLTMLLEGETGAGKELFARIIHLNSRRKRFVPVNCGALPSGVIESELFGHVKGAFTGATADRKGWFEEANGGTIFLDEVGELEPQAQVKFLRALDAGEIQRVGSDRVIKVDVRVIAATNRNLERMVADGSFREDLFYRLNICHLMIPPLRERRDEIALLFEFFLRTQSAEAGLPIPTVDPELHRFFVERYPFPGNIRELKNLALYIVHVFAGEPVRAEHLSQRYIRAWNAADRPADTGERTRLAGTVGRRAELQRVEREQLQRSLERNRGQVAAVCAELGMSRARAYQLFKKHGLRPDRFRSDP